MKVLCSLPLAVRIGFWLVALGFALGLVVGCWVGVATAWFGATVDRLGDVRSLSRVFYAERKDTRHTRSILILVVELLTTLLG